MKKLIAAAAATLAVLGAAATAQAETLDYDFTMVITEMDDPEGAFAAGGLELGGTLQGAVQLSTSGDWDGVADFDVEGVTVTLGGPWGNSHATTWVQPDAVVWNAGAGTPVLEVNSIELHGWAQENLILMLSEDSSGNLAMGSGSYYELRLNNGFDSFLRAEASDAPASNGVPELSPFGGMAAGVLLFGFGLVLTGRRRRTA